MYLPKLGNTPKGRLDLGSLFRDT
ncbi:hypothetical protein Zm00014a_016983 [Zea mays]|uniref:Uncharacterized protein n=1 Tax=Zea mays TaxID=4577 RepID=A0A3L6GE90_MAIZE|nr:hypothetical protein Zm00014a_016983 [Zea mays]